MLLVPSSSLFVSPGVVGVLLLPVSLWSWVLLLGSLVCWVPSSRVLPQLQGEGEGWRRSLGLGTSSNLGFSGLQVLSTWVGCWDHRNHCSRGSGVKCATSAAATAFIWGVGATAGMGWGGGWSCGYLCCCYWLCWGCRLSCPGQGTGVAGTPPLFPHFCLLYASHFSHTQMHRCVDLFLVLVCGAQKSLLSHGCPTTCWSKGRDKRNFSCHHDSDVTLRLFFIHFSSLFPSLLYCSIFHFLLPYFSLLFQNLKSPRLRVIHMEAQVFGTVSSSNTILFPWIPLYLSTMGGKFLFGIYCHCIHLKCKIWEKGIDHKASWDNYSGMMEILHNLTVVVVIQLYTSIRTRQTYT